MYWDIKSNAQTLSMSLYLSICLSGVASLPGYQTSVTVGNAIKNRASNEEILAILKDMPKPNQEEDDGEPVISVLCKAFHWWGTHVDLGYVSLPLFLNPGFYCPVYQCRKTPMQMCIYSKRISCVFEVSGPIFFRSPIHKAKQRLLKQHIMVNGPFVLLFTDFCVFFSLSLPWWLV